MKLRVYTRYWVVDRNTTTFGTYLPVFSLPEAYQRKAELPERRVTVIAKNAPKGDGHRIGAVRDRTQVLNPKTGHWTKRDSNTGQFIDQKADDKPFKGVTKED